jgi:hypothetical protein
MDAIHLAEVLMNLELLNTLATLGTLFVITGTAIAAIYQLRQMRGANQITALTEIRASQETPQFVRATHFVYSELPAKMQDPAFRYQVANRTARTAEFNGMISDAEIVGNSYENIGVLAKTGLVDRQHLLDIHSQLVIDAWSALGDMTAILRAHYGSAIWENFEYLAVLSQDWQAAHAGGNYPPGVRRIDVPNRWQADDERYAATLAT